MGYRLGVVGELAYLSDLRAIPEGVKPLAGATMPVWSKGRGQTKGSPKTGTGSRVSVSVSGR
jgi:hypothetical protein